MEPSHGEVGKDGVHRAAGTAASAYGGKVHQVRRSIQQKVSISCWPSSVFHSFWPYDSARLNHQYSNNQASLFYKLKIANYLKESSIGLRVIRQQIWLIDDAL